MTATPPIVLFYHFETKIKTIKFICLSLTTDNLFLVADSQLHLEQDELEKLKSTLIQDEDMKCVIYEDSMKNLTFGIGHLIVRGDPERGKEKGKL